MKINLLRSISVVLMIVALMFPMVESPAIAQSRTNLVLNGGFEQGFKYWSHSGAVKIVGGDRFLSFNNGSYEVHDGRVSQTVQTVPGTRYDLKLYAHENGDHGAASSKVNVLVNARRGSSLLNRTVEAYRRPWKQHTFNFTANSKQTILSITDISTGTLASTDINLDRISIVESAKQPKKESAKQPEKESAKQPEKESAKQPKKESAKQPKKESAKQPKKTLKYGQSYYLMNQNSRGYLDVGGPADYCAATTKSNIIADPDKTGATLWTFESATGASDGTAVSIGDLVYLQEPEFQSYLDICGLIDCQIGNEYPVVTDEGPDRYGVGTGTWKIESTTGGSAGTSVSVGDRIYLQNQWSFIKSYLELDQCDLDNSTPTDVVTIPGNPGDEEIWKIVD